ncbi:FHA domain-containing protein [Morus notabilis]|uniref:FHA domain-containing protein n=1 Tax=Morus notabilis TaxID=981085 RepID=W9QUM3_9ROSA|nr:FHA domain-containing protein [Morus notabilis]
MYLTGDGDTRHIGFKVAMPNAFEIASDEVTVGRLPDKADLVIPVATVSARHARIQKKAGSLVVTDLDSTNGTFINDKRLAPGVAATVSPGSYITFGDIHLAIFRASKLERTVESPSNSEGGSDQVDTDSPPTENT